MKRLWEMLNSCANQEIKETNSEFTFDCNNPLPEDIIDTIDLSKKNIPGLSNFEGNCYLNSILQCFYYCDDLTNYFINEEKEIIERGGKLSTAYLDLILRLNKKEEYNDAKIFLNILKEISHNFFKKGGNDPKAALFYLLDDLHDELKEEKIYYDENIYEEDIDEEIIFKRCKNIEENNKSIISELFNWCLLTINDCNKCGNKHYTCEYQNNLLIEINKYKTMNKYVKLDDLIKYYFKDVEKNFICNKYKVVFKAKFSQKIRSLSPYLIIILNRDTIKFNIIYNDIIDISEYCVNEYNTKYKFVGAILTNDFESKKATHSISRCITSEGSYIFNDLNTVKSSENIKGYNPYILFYKRL